MAEYVHVYHDAEERQRSTWHRYEDVGSLVRGVRDGDSERRYVLDRETQSDTKGSR